MKSADYYKMSQQLVDVAMGRTPADMVLQGGYWVNVHTAEIIDHTDIAIAGGRIAYVGPDASHTIGKNTRVIDADGYYLVPGLLDAHMHVESGMLTVTEFVRAVLPHGTTGMFIDPHEIANVYGLDGVKLIAEEATIQPIHVWVQMPSCVPSAPGYETPGATVGPREVAQAMTWDNVIGLGETMDFPAVYNNDEKIHRELAETRLAGKVIGGHYAAQDLGKPFHAYAASGVEDDHEGTRLEDAVIRARQGMKVMLRYGSAWHDVAEGVRAITDMGLDSRHFLLCTDDSHSKTLVYDGHVNLAVNQAIANGVTPITAIQMATINTAEHFGVARDVGSIAPGRYADILMVRDLDQIHPNFVIAKGQVLINSGKHIVDLPSYHYPEWSLNSVHFNRSFVAEDFRIQVNKSSSELPDTNYIANVIGIIENQAPTRHLKLEIVPTNGEIQVDKGRDLVKLALIERHHGTHAIQFGLVQGFGLTESCAIASTVSHDSHHLIVIGTNDADMALAVNTLAGTGGGQVVVHDGEVIGLVELPIAGLMSSERAEIVADKVDTVLDGFRQCGCTLNNPNMQLSLLSLVVIPELRISDLGLVDVEQFKFIDFLDPKL